jgi:hypothetical protein
MFRGGDLGKDSSEKSRGGPRFKKGDLDFGKDKNSRHYRVSKPKSRVNVGLCA